MKIELYNFAEVVNIVITRSAFEFREHSRVVNVALFTTPGIFHCQLVVCGWT